MDDVVDRNVLYTFQYRDMSFGKEVSHSFHPMDDTWDEILPEFKAFLQGIGFQFNVNDVFCVEDVSERSLAAADKIQSPDVVDVAQALTDGFEHGIETAAQLLENGFMRTLSQSDAIRLKEFLSKMKEEIKNENG